MSQIEQKIDSVYITEQFFNKYKDIKNKDYSIYQKVKQINELIKNQDKIINNKTDIELLYM